MKLKKFLKENSLNIQQFADALQKFSGITFPHESVRQYVKGKRIPRPERAKIIMDYSRGKITFEDIYPKLAKLK